MIPGASLHPDLGMKYDRLRSILRDLGSVVIGYSGGVDSSLLIRVAADVLGNHALAVIGKSATYPTREFEEAVKLAESYGIAYLVVDTEETDNIKFLENPPDRCYFCKTELFSKLSGIATQRGIPWILDGTITDDLGDFRPGMKARKEQNVRSPLLEAEMTKEDVRLLSKALGLSTWDKGSFACLSSRFPYGSGITRENLMRIDEAESFLHDLGFRSYRVRHHDDQTVRIELPPGDIAKLMDAGLRERIVDHLKHLGWKYITLDLQGYRTGSMNEVLSPEEKERYLK